jgi:hypothetical protein
VLDTTEQPGEGMRENFAEPWVNLAGSIHNCRSAWWIISLIFKDIYRGTVFACHFWCPVASSLDEVARHLFSVLIKLQTNSN